MMTMNLSDYNVNGTNNSGVAFLTSSENASLPRTYENVLIIYMFITAVLAISGNSVILLVEISNRCKTSTDWLIMFMAANDMSCALINIPFYIIFHLGYWSVIGCGASCKIHYYIEQTTMFSSTLLICVVAIDRYFKTCRPHRKFLTPIRAFRVCVTETMIACLVMSPSFLVISYNGEGFCSHREIAGGFIIKFLPGVFLISYLVMFVIVCVCYIRVAYTIKNKLVIKIKRPCSSAKELNPFTTSSSNCSNLSRQSANRRRWKVLNRFYLKRRNKIIPVKAEASSYCLRFYTGLEGIVFTNESDHHLGSGANTASSHGNGCQRNTSIRAALCHCCFRFCNGKRCEESTPYLNTEKHGKGVTGVFESKIHRTSKIMFVVTLVFIMSWVPTLAMFLIRRLVDYQNSTAGQALALFARKAYLVNTFTNPIFYIWMSSSFKERTRKTLGALFMCRK